MSPSSATSRSRIVAKRADLMIRAGPVIDLSIGNTAGTSYAWRRPQRKTVTKLRNGARAPDESVREWAASGRCLNQALGEMRKKKTRQYEGIMACTVAPLVAPLLPTAAPC